MSANVKRHPVKGIFAGLFLGLSLSILAMLYGGVIVGSPTALAIIGVGVVIGLVLSFVLPAKTPKAAR
jgi:uncharacterized membrane protein SpoIIM required for sporulation